MEALTFSSFQLTTETPTTQLDKFKPFSLNKKSNFSHSIHYNNKKRSIFTPFTALSSIPDLKDKEPEYETQDEKFNWYEQWYPIMPVCELDKRAPLGKKVMGIDVVVWWDRNESTWKVFDDKCPHRLAPLSEGRIDQWGRLQCVYHGWCFSGSGDCKFIPQAPSDGPPVHKSKKACAAVYPSTVQNDIVWFWPNSDPQYSDILSKKKPPYFPEIDDPSFTNSWTVRDTPYGYDVLMDNIMDPAHVPYVHYGVMKLSDGKDSVKADREGGQPIEIDVEKLEVNGYMANQGNLKAKFMAPCVFYTSAVDHVASKGTKKGSSHNEQNNSLQIFICVPVSPGSCRAMMTFPRNFSPWGAKFFPRWIVHVFHNLVIDADLCLLYSEDRKLMEIGRSN